MARAEAQPAVAAGSIVVPLALAQFIASYAGTNMNVAISNIADDLDTTVIGVQTAITLFTLTMAALMIPGSKLTDIWGRKFCFMVGLIGLRRRGADRRALPGPGRHDPRLLAPRGRRLGADDPADLHPHHGAVPPTRDAGQVLRHRQRRRRARRRRRPADRRPRSPAPSAGAPRSCCRSSSSRCIIVLARRIVDPRPRGRHRGSTSSAPSSPRPDCSSWCSASCSRATYGWLAAAHGLHDRRHRRHPEGRHLPGLAVRGHRRRCSSAGSSCTSAPRSGRARTRCCHRGCSATGRPTSGWSPRTSSG